MDMEFKISVMYDIAKVFFLLECLSTISLMNIRLVFLHSLCFFLVEMTRLL